MLPGITTEQMVEVDRIMMEDLGIPVELMMEHAGLNLAKIALQYFRDHSCTEIIVLAGSGNNGGGGITAARKLAAWGLEVSIYLPKGRDRLREVPSRQLSRALASGAILSDSFHTTEGTMVVDAYIGYGFHGDLDQFSQDLFTTLAKTSHIISLDTPSGLDTTTGNFHEIFSPAVTTTIAFPKTGLLQSFSLVGKVYLIDIGVPKWVFSRSLALGLTSPQLGSLDKLYTEFQQRSFVTIILDGENWSY